MHRQWGSIAEFEGFLDGGGIVEPGDAMPDDYRREIFRFIELHANSELMGALTERDWISRAPGIRRKQTVLAKTQDEIGHAHLLYMVAADLGMKSRDEMLDDLLAGRTRFHNVFHYQAHTWGDQVAIAYLVDAAALIAQQAVFKECSYGPYKRILRRIIAEEGFHMRQGEELVLLFAEGTDAQRRLFQDALDRWWLPALQLFGPDSAPDDPLLRWRIKSERNEVLRDRYVQKFVPLLVGYGFRVPDPELHHDDATGRWVIGEIDWAPLKATLRNAGPDSARRIGTAAEAWRSSAWVREALDTAEVRRAVATVHDPEYPGVTVDELGMLHGVRLRDGVAEIELLPTRLGCPALDLIRDDVVAAARAVPGVADATVTFLHEPAWSPDRVSPSARERLAAELTIAVSGADGVRCPVCGGTDVETVSEVGSAPCRSVARCTSCRNPVEVLRA